MVGSCQACRELSTEWESQINAGPSTWLAPHRGHSCNGRWGISAVVPVPAVRAGWAGNECGPCDEPETLCLHEGLPALLCWPVCAMWEHGPDLTRCPDFSGEIRDMGFYVSVPYFLNVCSCLQALWFQDSLHSWKIIERVKDFLFMWLYLLIFAILETKTGKLFNVYFSNKLIRC